MIHNKALLSDYFTAFVEQEVQLETTLNDKIIFTTVYCQKECYIASKMLVRILYPLPRSLS